VQQTLVVDCSVVAKWFLAEDGRLAATEVLDRWQDGEVLLIAPDLLLLEFASLLSKRHRRKQFTTDEARRAFRLMNYFSPELHDTGALLPLALDLSLSRQLSLWDCCYLALALENDCTMITADARLYRGGKPRHPSISLLA
jgi:predicted nucleic acid-binding protein